MSQYFVDSTGQRHKLPDDATPEEIDAITRRGPDPVEPNPLTMFTLGARNRALSFLPAAGGVVGGMAGAAGGPWGAIAGAGAGGAAGEGLREALMGEAVDPTRIGMEGGGQALGQGIGGLAAKGAAKLARPIMRNALRLGKPIGGQVKVGSELYPDPVETTLLENIQTNPKGAVKAGSLKRATGEDIGSLLRKEAAAGTEIKTSETLRYAKELLKDKSLPAKEKAKVFNELMTFYRDKGARMDPELAQAVKRRYGGKYKNWNKGKDPLTDPIEGAVAGEISRGAGEELNKIPGMAGLNQRYAALKGAEKATEKAVRRPDPLWQVQAPSTYPILRGLLGNKSLNSRVAIKLADPSVQEALRQTPRAIVELLEQLAYSDEPDATGQ